MIKHPYKPIKDHLETYYDIVVESGEDALRSLIHEWMLDDLYDDNLGDYKYEKVLWDITQWTVRADNRGAYAEIDDLPTEAYAPIRELFNKVKSDITFNFEVYFR